MSIEVEIAGVFRSYFDGQKTVAAEGSTVGDVLRYLSRKYPMTKNMLIDDDGKMQNRFEVYLNGKSIIQTGTATPVNDGDRIDLVYIIHGG
jgi:molybdopterin synthase sulfur carrier subunit